jgi:hypothetical protein
MRMGQHSFRVIASVPESCSWINIDAEYLAQPIADGPIPLVVQTSSVADYAAYVQGSRLVEETD